MLSLLSDSTSGCIGSLAITKLGTGTCVTVGFSFGYNLHVNPKDGKVLRMVIVARYYTYMYMYIYVHVHCANIVLYMYMYMYM